MKICVRIMNNLVGNFKKTFVIICSILLLFVFTACSNKSMSGLEGKTFHEKGNGGGHIVFSENKMIFAGSTVIKPSDNPADVEKNKDKIEKAKLKEFSNPKIVEENGKKYIKADGLDYKLVLENDNTIKDLDDNIEYVNVDTNSKEKK